MAALTEANSGEGMLEQGWQLQRDSNRGTTVSRAGLTFRLSDAELTSPGMDRDAPGAFELRFPKELRRVSAGYYVAIGNMALERTDAEPIVRIYWAVTPNGALKLVRYGTSVLNRAGVAFRLKVINEPSRFVRYDAGVLYVRRDDVRRDDGLQLFRLLEDIYSVMDPSDLVEGTPAFVKRIGYGIGIADDPGRSESFGLHRSLLVADAIIASHEARARSIDAKIGIARDVFRSAGVDLDRPFLGRGLDDIFDLNLHGSTKLAHRPHGKPTTRKPLADDYLGVALEIGRRLVVDAIWSDRRCNWIAATPLDPQSRDFGRSSSALGPELYSGTAGVAWFLAELAEVVDDPALRRTAHGAIQHALGRCRIDLVSSGRLGLYSGAMGVAIIAARIAALANDDELSAAALRVAADVTSASIAGTHDLLAGTAGAIVGLLALRGASHQDLLSAAARLGDRLITEAIRIDDMLSWPSSTQRPGLRNLTGLSHGAAGIGQAFLELFHATRERRFASAAESAFAYERSCFDVDQQNWPDFRETRRPTRRGRHEAVFCSFWCHGAPGIALSRLRGFEVLGSARCREEAESALRTTERSVEAWLALDKPNYSLCHGVSGNVEVLLEGVRVLGGRWTHVRELAERAALFGIENYAGAIPKWECGAPHGDELPSLMLGLAGIGGFYLRLFSPSIPSILLVRNASPGWIDAVRPHPRAPSSVVEHVTFDRGVPGSSPEGPASTNR